MTLNNRRKRKNRRIRLAVFSHKFSRFSTIEWRKTPDIQTKNWIICDLDNSQTYDFLKILSLHTSLLKSGQGVAPLAKTNRNILHQRKPLLFTMRSARFIVHQNTLFSRSLFVISPQLLEWNSLDSRMFSKNFQPPTNSKRPLISWPQLVSWQAQSPSFSCLHNQVRRH